MIRYLCALLLTAASIYMASLYESTAFAFMGCTMLFLIVSSLGYLLYEKKSLQAALDMLPSMTDKQEPIYVRVRAKHRYRGCYGKIKVQVAVSREGRGMRRCKWLLEDGAETVRGNEDCPGERQLSGFLTIEQAGSYEIRLKKVRIYDLTGLFCLDCRRKVRGECAVMAVLPPIYLMGIRLSETVRNFAGDAEVYDSLRSGRDMSEPLKLRPFQNGDKLRNIHWKLSAKADELLVRENSMPRGCPVAILVETAAGFQEAPLQCVASLSFCLMDLECPHYVAWYSGFWQDVVRVRVDDEESFYEALLYLTREQDKGNSMDILARDREKYSGEPILHHIRVEDGPRIRVDEQETVNLKAPALEQELSGLELLL